MANKIISWNCSIKFRSKIEDLPPHIIKHKVYRETIMMYGSWIYNYLCNQCLSPLTLWVRTTIRQGVLDTTLYDEVFQWLGAGQWFSLVSSTNKTDCQDISEIMLKVALNTITPIFLVVLFLWCTGNIYLCLKFTVTAQCKLLKLKSTFLVQSWGNLNQIWLSCFFKPFGLLAPKIILLSNLLTFKLGMWHYRVYTV